MFALQNYFCTEHCLILGAGDVIAKRLLPALLKHQFASRYRILHDGKCHPGVRRLSKLYSPFVTVSDISDEASLTKYSSSIVFVATPPDVRMSYLKTINSTKPIILEKPLVTNQADLANYLSLAALRDSCFCLGYYAQEKALPWTWLNTGFAVYQNFLQVDHEHSFDDVLNAFRELGSLIKLNIYIKEGRSRLLKPGYCFWYQNDAHGVWFDMGIHAEMLSLLAAGSNEKISNRTVVQSGTHQYQVKAQIGNTRLYFEFGKGFSEKSADRYLEATYESGKVTCSFDHSYCQVFKRDKLLFQITPTMQQSKYRILVGLVKKFVESGGWHSEKCRYDLEDIQIRALRSMIEAADGLADERVKAL